MKSFYKGSTVSLLLKNKSELEGVVIAVTGDGPLQKIMLETKSDGVVYLKSFQIKEVLKVVF